MKKIMGILAVSCLLCFSACDSDSKDTTKKDDIAAGDVPAAVQSSFSAKYSTATDIKWEDAHENNVATYKAKFKMGDKKMKAEFDAGGNFIKESEDN